MLRIYYFVVNTFILFFRLAGRSTYLLNMYNALNYFINYCSYLCVYVCVHCNYNSLIINYLHDPGIDASMHHPFMVCFWSSPSSVSLWRHEELTETTAYKTKVYDKNTRVLIYRVTFPKIKYITCILDKIKKKRNYHICEL